jgi:plasmid stabilization system protein ParE
VKGFVLTLRAKQDVSDIWDYIADENIEAADRVLDALETTMVKLARIPPSATGAKN